MPTPSSSPARRGLMLVLSSPSGAGKTTLARGLLETDDRIAMSVSLTTRLPRPGEVDGRDYHFIDASRFEAMREAGELLEWAEVHGNLYATPRGPVMDALTAGRDVLFDIDWQGARQIAMVAATDLVRVFVLPPTAQALRTRLTGRAQDSEEVIRRRLAGAAHEIAHWPEYDYVIVNEDVGQSLATLHAILASERHRATRQAGLHELTRGIMAALAADQSDLGR